MPQARDGEMEARQNRGSVVREPLAKDGEREAGRKRRRVGRKPLAQGGESVEEIKTTDARAAPEEEGYPSFSSPCPDMAVSSGSSSPSPSMAALPEKDSSGLSPNIDVSPKEESSGSDVEDLSQDFKDDFRRIMARYVANRANDAAQVQRESLDCCKLTVESEFCDVDDGSFQSCEARMVAVRASRSVVGLSSFADGQRIRVCSGCVITSNESSDTTKILTSATLVRSVSTSNSLIPDIKIGACYNIRVCLPNADIFDGSILMVDFHYNIAVVEVNFAQKFPEAVLVTDVINRGDVLAIGRFYDHGGVMCAQGEIRKQASSFECSELLVSSCGTTMAGVGGPLVNYSGHVVGINFYGENHTPFLSTAVIIRCLEQWKSYGKTIRPWLGLVYTPVDMLPLRVLDKCKYIDNGFYISKVAKGSPAEVAGLCVGDVLIECAGKVLSTAPELGALLLDLCSKQMESCTSESNMTVEVVVWKQRNGRKARKAVNADVLSGCSYYSWYDPLPIYNDKKMATMRFMEYC